MSKKLKSKIPLDAAACSPSSDTPETEAIASMRRTITEWREHSAKLERERNALRCELVTLRVAAQGVIERWDTPLWKEAQATAKYIHRLRSALSENDKDLARRALDSE